MIFLSKSVEETVGVAGNFLEKISSQKNHKATVVGLFGDLGSGKTTFTQALGKHLGVVDVMTSPTFVIEKRYDLDGIYGFKKLIHIDAYRLDSSAEILNLNFQEDLNNPDNLILIEWPERVESALPGDTIKINFKFISEFEREIDVI
jgi:tRNA threonylcarbamoyladenosine biosynthesis protein TsaE